MPLLRRERVPPCAVRRLRVTSTALGQGGELNFGEWPGPFYGNITLPYGTDLVFETTDGAEIRSSLKYWRDDGPWYHYFEPRSQWPFTATFDEESLFDLEPGRAYEFAAWFMAEGQLCNLRIDMQWDPPAP